MVKETKNVTVLFYCESSFSCMPLWQPSYISSSFCSLTVMFSFLVYLVLPSTYDEYDHNHMMIVTILIITTTITLLACFYFHCPTSLLLLLLFLLLYPLLLFFFIFFLVLLLVPHVQEIKKLVRSVKKCRDLFELFRHLQEILQRYL